MKKTNGLYIKLGMFFLIICILLISTPKYASSIYKTETIESKMDEFIAQHEDTTAALATVVIHGDETLVHRIIGYADIENNIRADGDTVFEWGSCSKILVWISVMQLVEDGLLDLNKDIQGYLPEDFTMPNSYDEPITILHLMNHNAGFDDSYTDLMVLNSVKMPTLRQALEQADIKQVFRPGDVVAYSNYGSALAAYIVEVISGMDYREYVKENIFMPLGMTHTSIDPQQKDNAWVKAQREKVQGYTRDKKLIDPNLYSIPIYPAGSTMGTMDDFARLLTALLSDDGACLFKEKETIDMFFQPTAYYPETNVPRMAHGLFALPAKEEVYGHGGNTMAFSSSIYIDRESGLGVLVMTNQLGEENFCCGIPELIFGRPEDRMLDEGALEDPTIWEGIYQPVRLPYHGFTKFYGLLNRGSTKKQGAYGLVANKHSYKQQAPGIYTTEDDFSIYSQDIYWTHPDSGKILSSIYTDLIHIPFWRHLLEMGIIIVGAIGILFSMVYILLIFTKKIKLDFPIVIQNISNIILAINIGWMAKKAFSMTSYSSLRVGFGINILYLILTVLLWVYTIFRKEGFRVNEGSRISYVLTMFLSIIIWINLLYWEFYH